MGSALDHHAGGCFGVQQQRQDRLRDQDGASGTADRKAVIAGPEFPRREHQFLRTDFGAAGRTSGDFGDGLHAGQMLPHQARLAPFRPDIRNTHLPAGQGRKGERAAQDLPAAFAAAAVDFNHCPSPVA